MATGSGGGAGTLGVDSSSRLTTLTTDFHEFIGQVTKENQAVLQYGPFFQWSEKVRKDNPVPSGPLNPQALNRYSYALNDPLRYVDPTGHDAWIHFRIAFNEAAWAVFAARVQDNIDKLAAGGANIQNWGGISEGASQAALLAKYASAVNIPVAVVSTVGTAVVGAVGECAHGGCQSRDLQSVINDLSKVVDKNGQITLDMWVFDIEGLSTPNGSAMMVVFQVNGAGAYRSLMCPLHARCAGAQFIDALSTFLSDYSERFWGDNSINIDNVWGKNH